MAEVVLLDFWASGFGMRVKIALAEKGIEYDLRQEDLTNKTQLLLKMNPVHKKIPVLIHNDKPVCESLIAIEYIDEVWSYKNPLMPSDPYKRAQARFWTDFVDTKIYNSTSRILRKNRQENEAVNKEFIECLKLMEEKLGDEPYFGGETFGYVDIALIPYYSWFYSCETIGNFSIEKECPKIMTWVKRCLQKESVSKSLADPNKVYGYCMELRKRYNIE